MAEEKKVAEPGDTLELKDKEVGFTDPNGTMVNADGDSVKGFDISRSQHVQIGDSVGDLTHQAVLSGGLLIVSGKPSKRQLGAAEGDGAPPDDYDLPADLPGREAFVAAGITTFAGVKELDTEEKLLAVKGIGKGTVRSLTELGKG